MGKQQDKQLFPFPVEICISENKCEVSQQLSLTAIPKHSLLFLNYFLVKLFSIIAGKFHVPVPAQTHPNYSGQSHGVGSLWKNAHAQRSAEC